MSISFENRVVIVTGAGAGIGRSHALEIARRGGAVVVNDLGGAVEGGGSSKTAADTVVAEIVAAGGRAVASYDSVATAQGGRNIVAAALDHFGRVDALINNAGNIRIASFEETTDDDLESCLASHLRGTYYVTKAVWPHLKKQHYGRVVFTSSSAGMYGNELQCAYGAAKAGVTGLMNVLALEGAPHGILCNALMPNAAGRMASKMAETLDAETRQKRMASLSLFENSMEPAFNSGIAVYLASEACTDTHAIYSSCAGRIARVFVGATVGWQGSRKTPATVEDIAEHLGQIRDLGRGVVIHNSPFDEVRAVLSGPAP